MIEATMPRCAVGMIETAMPWSGAGAFQATMRLRLGYARPMRFANRTAMQSRLGAMSPRSRSAAGMNGCRWPPPGRRARQGMAAGGRWAREGMCASARHAGRSSRDRPRTGTGPARTGRGAGERPGSAHSAGMLLAGAEGCTAALRLSCRRPGRGRSRGRGGLGRSRFVVVVRHREGRRKCQQTHAGNRAPNRQPIHDLPHESQPLTR